MSVLTTKKQPMVSIIDSKATTLKMRYEEYLAWVDEDIHAEWIPIDDSNEENQ